MVGLNATRAYTLTAGRGKMISVGRVQTPTLNLVVERDAIVEQFKELFYYSVVGTWKGYQAQLLDDIRGSAGSPTLTKDERGYKGKGKEEKQSSQDVILSEAKNPEKNPELAEGTAAKADAGTESGMTAEARVTAEPLRSSMTEQEIASEDTPPRNDKSAPSDKAKQNVNANEYETDSIVRVDGRWPENNATIYKDSGTYALYKEEVSQGSMVSYSDGKKYEEGTIDYSGDTLVISHVLYGDYKRAHLTTMKMHISNDTLHYYQDSYSGYPDTVAYPDTSRVFLIDNPEKENHCLQYYYNSDKNEWVQSSSDISYAFKGDTLIFSRRSLDIDDIYEDKVNYLVLNSVLFDKHTTKSGFHRIKPYSTLSNKEKYHDVKGRLHSKTIPYRVLFGIGE